MSERDGRHGHMLVYLGVIRADGCRSLRNTLA